MREAVIEKIYDLAKIDKRVVFIGSDLGCNTLKRLKEEFPERYYMEGICEQNIIGLAAGLCFEGFVPYIVTISSFLTRRCLEQIIIDAGLHRLPIRLIGFGGGVAYAPLGPTHWAVDDFAILRSIPNMTLLAPCDEFDSCSLLEQSLNWKDPLYLRMGKGEDEPVFNKRQEFEVGIPVITTTEGSILIISCGTMTQRALQAAKMLPEEFNVKVLHIHTIKPLAERIIIEALFGIEHAIVLEEHSIIGGLGTAVAEILFRNPSLRKSNTNFHHLGLPDEILHGYGTQSELLGKYHLDAYSIAQFIKNNCLSKGTHVSLSR